MQRITLQLYQLLNINSCLMVIVLKVCYLVYISLNAKFGLAVKQIVTRTKTPSAKTPNTNG
jgi:hypothetical protein